jgi:inactivated superfamily I helicase
METARVLKQELQSLNRQETDTQKKKKAVERALQAITGETAATAIRAVGDVSRGIMLSNRNITQAQLDSTLGYITRAHPTACLRRAIEEATNISSANMSFVLAHLVNQNVIEQKSAPAKRHTTWGLVESRLTVRPGGNIVVT